MLLYISIRLPNEKKFYQSIYSNKIETLMEVLNDYINSGYELLSALLIDSDSRAIYLPIEVFDGKPIGNYMQELEMEYENVLFL